MKLRILVVCLIKFVLAEHIPETYLYATPEYIIPCYKTDPNINQCIRNTFNHLKPFLINGIQDLDVPSIDPLKIDNIVMENGKGSFKVKASFYNVSVTGGTNYTVETIKADVENYNIELGIKLPRIEIRGKYDVSGNVLLFPLKSKGDFWAVFVDGEGTGKIYGKEFKNKENIRFMEISKMTIDFKLRKSRFKIRDVINRGNVIGRAINQFLNNNSEDIIAEMKPAANVAIAKYFKGLLNNAFHRLPLMLWLPDA